MQRDEYTQKIEALVEKGLTSQTLIESVLKSQSLTELSRFVIDLNLSDELIVAWIKALSVHPDKSETIRIAMKSCVPDELSEALTQSEIDANQLIRSLMELAGSRQPMEIVSALFDTDLNTYEIFTCLNHEPGLSERLKKLSGLIENCNSAKEVFMQYCNDFPLSDQLAICNALDLSDSQLKEIAKSCSLEPSVLKNHSPEHLARMIQAPLLFTKALSNQLSEITVSDLSDTLISREYARSHWFQTVGPNVLHSFSGVLSKGISSATGKKKVFPDFHLVIYRDGTVRAHQTGPDKLLSTPEEAKTIVHAYEGFLKGEKLSLQECSAYEKSDQRPSLGALEFEQFKPAPSGLEANFRWNGKLVTLKWHPGF